jgi:hypothetical protein
MSDDVDDIGCEDKKVKSELKQVNKNSFAGQEEHQGNMLPKSPPESPWMLLPDPVPDQEHPSDELEPLDLGQLDRQLELGDMSWSIPNMQQTCMRMKAASDANTAQHRDDASLVQ